MAAPLNDHRLRGTVLDEVHARPIDLVPSVGRVRRISASLPAVPEANGRAFETFSQWCLGAGVEKPRGRQHTYRVNGFAVTWELHTEFVTLTWIAESARDVPWPEGIGIETLRDAGLLAATRVDILDSVEVPENLLPGFSLPSLSVSWVEERRGQIACDFIPDPDGFVRFECAAGGLNDVRRSVLVRRLLEIDTYRAYALLGLPLARELSPELARLEAGVAREVEKMSDVDTVDEARVAVDALNRMSVDAGRLGEATGFRFAASFAYADVLDQRLHRLGEETLGTTTTLTRYLGNRVDPAIATCRAFEKRLEALSGKLDRAIRLLNTRISLDVEIQNRTLLQRISETGQSQFMLQRTVEGLSTIAISYYALGILSYVLEGAKEVGHFSKPLTVALAAPVVVLLVWIGLRLVQRRHGPH
jgi:uncharacterized membrane-anchored protein